MSEQQLNSPQPQDWLRIHASQLDPALVGITAGAPAEITQLEGGVHNFTFLVRYDTASVVARTARYPERIRKVPAEHHRLQMLQKRLGAHSTLAPRPLHLDTSPDQPYPVLYMEFLEGESLPLETLGPSHITQLAHALSRLHSIESSRYSPRSGTEPSQQGTFADYMQAMIQETVNERRQALEHTADFQPALTLLDAGQAALNELLRQQRSAFTGHTFSLLHHDLNPGNIIWGKEVRFIDWENALFGDKADDVDYLVTNNNLDEKFCRQFLQAYEAASGDHSVRKRLPAYRLKNRLDDLAWAMVGLQQERTRQAHREDHRVEQYEAFFVERFANLESLLQAA